MSNKPRYSTKTNRNGKLNPATGDFEPPVRFFNIPFEWAQYFTGYEFEAVNKDGSPKLTKGKQPVKKKIDYLDLMLLDYIRSFEARRTLYCIAESVAVADAVGMVGQEKEVCERVLQLAAWIRTVERSDTPVKADCTQYAKSKRRKDKRMYSF